VRVCLGGGGAARAAVLLARGWLDSESGRRVWLRPGDGAAAARHRARAPHHQWRLPRQVAMDAREERMAAQQDVLEQRLHLLGATAVEDKLQVAAVVCWSVCWTVCSCACYVHVVRRAERAAAVLAAAGHRCLPAARMPPRERRACLLTPPHTTHLNHTLLAARRTACRTAWWRSLQRASRCGCSQVRARAAPARATRWGVAHARSSGAGGAGKAGAACWPPLLARQPAQC
jgi:hypothetical protein